MPDIGVYHPQIVHFVVALLFIGVPARILAFLRKPKFLSPMATTLILIGAAASVVAAKSGEDAHGPSERIPGARDAVHTHEELGERARNVFLLVAALEIAGLVLRERKKAQTGLLIGSSVIGVIGLFVLAETAEHGGEIVYEYAGGVGTRSGEADDIERLLLAGLYYQARQDRDAGRAESAAELTELMGRRFADDPAIQMLVAESLLRDRNDPRAALDLLAAIPLIDASDRLIFQHGMMAADALEAAGIADTARMVLEGLRMWFPESERIARRLQELGGG